MLDNVLEKLGFTKKEIRVYETVLKKRRISPAEIARITRLNRSTVYAVAKALVSKGLIAEDLGSKKRELVPLGEEDLKKIIKRDEEELKQKEKLIRQVMSELALSRVGEEYAVPKIRFVEEGQMLEHMYARTPAWNDSVTKYDSCWRGFQDHTFVEHYWDWIDWFWTNAPKGIHLKLLSNQSAIENKIGKKHSARQIKPWSKGNFTATTWIVGDYIVLIRTDVHPFSLVEIHDATLAHNMREVFKNLWPLV